MQGGGDPAPVADAVVEIWHCDAGGVYSGFESGVRWARPAAAAVEAARLRRSYSEGVQEASPTDDGTFLRGAQVTDTDGVARFTTIYPGWYRGRTVHIHLKVHVDKRNVLTTQLYFDEALNESRVRHLALRRAQRAATRSTTATTSSTRPESLATSRTDDGYRAVINLGLEA